MRQGDDMKLHLSATSAMALAAALTATGASAIGLDRSNQDVTAIFEEGNVAELSFGKVFVDLSGEDNAPAMDRYDDVGDDFTNAAASLKMDFGNGFSGALIIDQPFGADISYEGEPTTPAAASVFNGTMAHLDSRAVTAVGRYRLNENVSFHAGLRREWLEADITLAGAGYAGLSGYRVELAEDGANGYLVGAAYEKPEIALRVALTYNSAIDHEFDTVETLSGNPLPPSAPTEVQTPEAWNLDMQTGIAPDTLAFANIRYATYEDTRVSPEFFSDQTGGVSLTDIDDNYSIQVGIGRRFSDMFSGQAAIGFEPEGDERISPLDPTDGKRWVSLGGAYNMEAVTVSGGVRYTMLGDAEPRGAASFEDNSALAVGMSVAYRF